MAQVRKHIPELQGLNLQDYRNVPKIGAILCEEWGMLDLWWFMMGQFHQEGLLWDDARRDYKAASPFYNSMGMRPARIRTTYQMEGSIKDKGLYGQYANYADMVADLLQWYKNNKILEGLQLQKARGPEYVNFGQLLKSKNYMGDSSTNYNNGIKSALGKYGNQINTWLQSPFFGSGGSTNGNGETTPESSFNSEQGELASKPFWMNPIVWGVVGLIAILMYGKKGEKRSFKRMSYGKY